MNKILTKGALSLLSIVVTLVFVEFLLSALFPPAPYCYVWKPHLYKVFKPSPQIMPGIHGDSRFIVNSQGIRGDELSEEYTYRILTIGGSATECLYLDQSESWPYLLQEKLNQGTAKHKVWVGNIAKSGLSSRDNLVQLRYLLQQQPNVDAIVVLVGVNDFLLRLKQGTRYDSHFLDRPEAEQKLLIRSFSLLPRRYQGATPFYQRLVLWQLAEKSRRFLTTKSQDEMGMNYEEARNKRRTAKIRESLPDLTEALEEYSRNIHRLIDMAEARPLRIIFLTQPYLWRKNLSKELSDLLWMGWTEDRRRGEYYSAEALSTGMERYNQMLLKICRLRRIEYLDLASLTPQDTRAFYDDVHVNEKGAETLAGHVARYMLRRKPFK